MSSRTTDLSDAFIKWRAEHDMTILKGQGAIASVSGWKATIRKVARDRGLIELAEMGPGGTTTAGSSCPQSNKTKLPQLGNASTSSSFAKTLLGANKRKVTHPDVLFGKSTHRVVVESTRGTCSAHHIYFSYL